MAIAVVLCALTAWSQPSYWWQQMQRKPDAAQSQAFWFVPGANVTFTYATNHVIINSSGGGGGSNTFAVAAGTNVTVNTNGNLFTVSAASGGSASGLTCTQYVTLYSNTLTPLIPYINVYTNGVLKSSTWNQLADLLAWWPLDDGAGIAPVDHTGNGYTAALVGAPPWVAGKIGTAVQFNGASQSMSATPISTESSIVTVALWFWWDAFANNDALMLDTGANGPLVVNGIIIDPNSSSPTAGKFQFSLMSGTPGNFTGCYIDRPSSGAWHHLAVVFDSATIIGKIVVFLDGSTATTTSNSTRTANYGNILTTTLHFMSRNNASLWAAGKLDDVRIYTRRLSPVEVAALYNGGSGLAP